MSVKKPIYREFLEKIDVLVDGRFVLEERDLSLLFRGSRNQRLIDVKQTLKTGNIVLFDEKEYSESETYSKPKVYV